MRLQKTSIWLAPVVLMWLSACGTVAPIAMTPPQGFEAQSDAFLAGNRSADSGLFANESFDLGPYRVTDVKRDWADSKASFSLGPLTWGKSSNGFAYVLRASNSTLHGRCEVNNGETRLPLSVSIIPLQSRFSLKCDCQGDGAPARMELASNSGWQQQDAWLPESLKLTIGEQSFSGSPFDHRGLAMSDGRAFVGYRFDGQAGPAAAVGLFSPGEVWLHQSLPASQRAAMTCALAGLLLHTGP
ncbi:hypothetical protein [Roseateles oligotrophus]|uniref:Lipoprotein n=1 Tax=Roseateles oligotrophus TaxID=1769250 RepID=A0ABT2YD17_9BURK|nr:hypothetical protein [Roseateles oligotrophus]MCV2367933.1 hypothetical protein [Roseateles oligotrophus]